MDLLERAKQKLEESKKVPDDKISPGGQDKKIIPGEVKISKGATRPLKNDQKSARAHPEKNVLKSNFAVEKLPEEKKTKKGKIMDPHQIDAQTLDQKINERINKRLLNLVKLGLKHELTIDNMVHYFKQVNKAKLYELRRFFSDSSSYEIEKMLKFLYTSGGLKKDKDNWYSLKPGGQ